MEVTTSSTTNSPAFPGPQLYGTSTPPPNLTGSNGPESNPSSPLVSPEHHRPPPATAAPKPRPRRKPDPIATKSTPPCTECGKRFTSWKALFGHMRCHPDRQWRGIIPPPHFRRPLLSPATPLQTQFSHDEYDVATSLILLSNGPPRDDDGVCRFECTSCGKAFGSQQALGRHRATHNGGSKKRTWDEIVVAGSDHRCSVCPRVFASGQALGGHMRCHWEKEEHVVGSYSTAKCYVLDLNLPPPVEGNEGSSSLNASPALDLKLGVF